MRVPSLVLWQRVLDQARHLTWWERVRRAVSLAATILIAVALAIGSWIFDREQILTRLA